MHTSPLALSRRAPAGPVSLRCLEAVALAGPAGLRALDPARLTKPLELLLRVVAAGTAGASAEQVVPALWPASDARRWRASLTAALRALDAQLAVRSAVILDGDRLLVREAALRVDSLDFERALAPLLNPFRTPGPQEIEGARIAVASFGGAEFLPGNESAWARAARMRIADAAGRAARRIAQPHFRNERRTTEQT
jgi:two-component SAPR family response regulator